MDTLANMEFFSTIHLPPPVYYFYRGHNGSLMKVLVDDIISFELDVNIENALIKLSDERYPYIYANFNTEHKCWLLHRVDAPAAIFNDVAIFYFNGIQYDIDNYPCDEETRCFLRLKYG